MKKTYIEVTQEAGAKYFSIPSEDPIVMLNLLKFKEVADYSISPELKPKSSISGEKAYELYIQEVLPLLKNAGSELLFSGKGGSFLIGPSDVEWDLILLVQHRSRKDFMAFASDPEYKKIAGHRTAAVADSRLLPISTDSE